MHVAEDSKSPVWERVSLKPVASRPILAIHPPQYVTPEIVEFVLDRLLLPKSSSL
jgi:hypothetical protein